MFVLQNMLCVCFKLCMFYALSPFWCCQKGRENGYFRNQDIIFFQSFKIKHKFKKKGGERDEWTVEQNMYAFSWFQDCHHQKRGDCGSNAFQDYFDDVKELRVKQIPKIQESSFKNQDSRFKNQVSRIKIQDSRFKNQEKT